jgi:hypothetical protein
VQGRLAPRAVDIAALQAGLQRQGVYLRPAGPANDGTAQPQPAAVPA